MKLANIDIGRTLPDLGAPGSHAPGTVLLANENRFTAAYYSEPLTTYAVGWRDPEDILGTLNAMCPVVPVPRRFEYKEATNAEAFLSETDDARAIGAPHKRVEYTGKSTTSKTTNRGLVRVLDKDEMVDGDEERTVQWLINRGYRSDLRRLVTALYNASTNTGKTWDTTAGKDPDQDVETEIITSGDARGMNPNCVVYGETAWSKRHLSHRAQNIAGGYASAALTPQQLAQYLNVDRVVISRERYQSSTTAKSKIVSAYVLIYLAQMNQSKDDPSNVKRFVTMTESGEFRVYRQEFAKTIEITVERYNDVVITSTLGIRSLTIS